MWRWWLLAAFCSSLLACHDAHHDVAADLAVMQQRLKRALAPRVLPDSNDAHALPGWSRLPWRWSGEIRHQGQLHGVFLQSMQTTYYFTVGVMLPHSTWRVIQITADSVLLENAARQPYRLHYTKSLPNH